MAFVPHYDDYSKDFHLVSSVVLSYISPLGDIESVVYNHVSASCLRDIKILLEKDRRINQNK